MGQRLGPLVQRPQKIPSKLNFPKGIGSGGLLQETDGSARGSGGLLLGLWPALGNSPKTKPVWSDMTGLGFGGDGGRR
jgi:hypothetical protein